MSPKQRYRLLLSWSSGKDSAWTLYQLQQNPDVEVAGLLTTFNSVFDRSAIHGVRQILVEMQAEATNLPLINIPLPWPCSNAQYEDIMSDAVSQARDELKIEAIAFGDLFLEDVRRYREDKMAGTGIDVVFPIWGRDTRQLAEEMISSGLKATVTCLNPQQIPGHLAGSLYNDHFLACLPRQVDPCGENGEFHTFAWDGPMFNKPINAKSGEVVQRDGFLFADLLPLEMP